MAENKIRFKLGVDAEPNMLKTATDFTQSLGKGAKQGKEVLGEVITQLKAAGGSAAELAGGFETMARYTAQFGLIGAAIGGVKVACDQLVSSINEKVAEADRAFQKMNAEIARGSALEMAAQMDVLKTAIQAVKDATIGGVQEFKNMANAAAAVQLSVDATSSAAGKSQIASLLLEKAQAIIEAEDNAAKEYVNAEYNLAVAKQEQTNAVYAAEQERSAAHTAQMNAVTQYNLACDAVTATENALAEAKEAERMATIKGSSDLAEATAARKQLEKELSNAIAKRSQAETDMAVADEKMKQATFNAQTTQDTCAAKVLEAQNAFDQLKAKTEYLTSLEEDLSLTDAERKAAEEAYTAALKDGKSAEDAEKEATDALEEEKTKEANVRALIRNLCVSEQKAREALLEQYKQGYTDNEAYRAAFLKLRDATESVTEKMEENADTLSNPSEKMGEAIGKSIKTGGTAVTVDTSSLAQAIKDSDDWSEANKKAEEHTKKMSGEEYPMYVYLKGRMKDDQMKVFEDYMRSHYTSDEISMIGAQAIKNQLISTQDQKAQMEAIVRMGGEGGTLDKALGIR